MNTVRKFDHNGRSFEVRMIADDDGWQLKVFVDGKPTKVGGSVGHEVQHDAGHYNIGDPRAEIADALVKYIKGDV